MLERIALFKETGECNTVKLIKNDFCYKYDYIMNPYYKIQLTRGQTVKEIDTLNKKVIYALNDMFVQLESLDRKSSIAPTTATAAAATATAATAETAAATAETAAATAIEHIADSSIVELEELPMMPMEVGTIKFAKTIVL
jgi:hypothetical protein